MTRSVLKTMEFINNEPSTQELKKHIIMLKMMKKYLILTKSDVEHLNDTLDNLEMMLAFSALEDII